MKKILRYTLLIGLPLVLVYHSVYFESLSVRQNIQTQEPNFEALADSLYFQGIAANPSPLAWETLLLELESEPDAAFTKYGNRLGIGNSAYFMVQLDGNVQEITPDHLLLQTSTDQTVIVETKFIFGNALRDASQTVKLTDFKTTTEFNRLSEALNKLVRNQIIPEALTHIASGDSVTVLGAVKLSRLTPIPTTWRLIPAQLIRVP